MKDQFANYVVQKILHTCTASQREMLLGRIRIHLNSLKKYTYGKHIVARFEQLYGEGVYNLLSLHYCHSEIHTHTHIYSLLFSFFFFLVFPFRFLIRLILAGWFFLSNLNL